MTKRLSHRLEQPQQDGSSGADRPRILRKRIFPIVRREIVDSVLDGQYNGVEAARAYSVSEATVHRFVKAELAVNPGRTRIDCRQPSAKGQSNLAALNVNDDDYRGRRSLSVVQRKEIVERLYAGYAVAADLAREFDVHKSTISRVLSDARRQRPSEALPEIDREEWQRRVIVGVGRSIASGLHPASKLRLSPEIQRSLLNEYDLTGASFTSLGRAYGVAPSTAARLVRAHRVRPGPDKPQSLEEIMSDLVEGQRKL